MADIDDTRQVLQDRWQQLCMQWAATREVWNDLVRKRFEEEHWVELDDVVPGTLSELKRLAEVLARARRQVH